MKNLFSFARPRLEVAEDRDLNQVLRSALERFDEQLRRKGIVPVVALLPTLALVAGDAALLRQMCGNLIQNACQAMDKGGTLTIVTSMATESIVELSIADQGFGLGLTVCQSIIQEHMGCITVCRLPEGGSIFSIRLPITPSFRSTS